MHDLGTIVALNRAAVLADAARRKRLEEDARAKRRIPRSAMEAYDYADMAGYVYQRARIGFSVYRHPHTGRTLEIGKHCAVIYGPPAFDMGGRKLTKAERMILVWDYARKG